MAQEPPPIQVHHATIVRVVDDLPALAAALWQPLCGAAIPRDSQIDLMSTALEAAHRAVGQQAHLQVRLEQVDEAVLRLVLKLGGGPTDWLSELGTAMHDEFELKLAPATLELRHPLGSPIAPGEAPQPTPASLAELACVLAHRVGQLRRTSLQLGEELEETNQGVLALYQELDDKAAKLSELNETLEQRVAARTAEAEQRAVKLRAMTLQLSEVEQQERRRLAETLHDHLQQILVAGKMRLSLLPSLKEDQLRPTLEQLNELLDESIRITKDLTVQLSPPVLHHAELPAALGWLAERMRQQHELNVQVHCEPGEQDRFGVNPQVKQLLFESVRELLFNTIKHAGVNHAAVICRLLEDDRLEVEVADTGSGFDVADVETRGRGGFGLLSVRERLECLGGQMILDSRPGAGTRTRLIAPAHPREQAEVDEAASYQPAVVPEASAPGGSPARAIRLMLADDHRLVREGLRAMLEAEQGVDVIGEADDGEQAIRLAQELCPDGIVMDVNMPRMDGIAATRHIHRQWPQIKVIGLSMHHEQEVFDAMREAGAVACLRKDEAGSELMALVHQVICRDRSSPDEDCEHNAAVAADDRRQRGRR
jgi:signal transduction histidine kinase/CheY-like chemotaxis protein